MNPYEQTWHGIQGSPFWGVYIHEIYWLAHRVHEECEAIFSETPPAAVPGQGYIRVDRTIHERLISVLLVAARLRALLRDRELGTSSSRTKREVMSRRTADLRALLTGIDLHPLLDGSGRHAIEHFDERLDDLAIKAFRGQPRPPTFYPLDMVLSTRTLLDRFDVGGEKANCVHVRVYIADEKIFANCGEETALQPLSDRAREVVDRLAPLLPDFAKEEKGASMLVVAKDTFKRQ